MSVNNEDRAMNHSCPRNLGITQTTGHTFCSSANKGRISADFRVFLFRARLDLCYKSPDSV